jgi:peptidoglycan hydrolase-like protein with peptidoglycan-binding domain
VSGSGWFRRKQTLLANSETSAANETSAAKRFWQAFRTPRPLKRRGTALTASGAVLVLGAGVMIVAFASPGSHASLVSSAAQVNANKPLQPAAGLQLVSMAPAAGAKGVIGTNPIRVQFSAPLSASSPMPTLSPSIPGHWAVQGNAAVFTPTVGYLENTRVTVNIPGGLAGVMSAAGATAGDGGTLGSNLSQSFTTGWFSTMRLQQLLAQLGYLPMTWTSTSSPAISPANAKAELAAAYSAPAGTFSWQSGYPWNLTSQWKAGSANILDVGAIRAFESVSGMTMDGIAGNTVWAHLFTAVAKGQNNPNGYTYALASQHYPESLTVWHNGRVVLKTAANTGIPESPTVDGTFPVYLKYYFSYMKGTNPDGSQYDDPVYYANYFNGGDAVHQFDRYSYGFYQSLGCVELPWDSAKTAYSYLSYGSLVTVTGPVA